MPRAGDRSPVLQRSTNDIPARHPAGLYGARSRACHSLHLNEARGNGRIVTDAAVHILHARLPNVYFVHRCTSRALAAPLLRACV